MNLAYLTNQYPAVSHSFIRREIAALERLGVSIERITLRRSDSALPDRADRDEALTTKVILERSSAWLLLSSLGRLLPSAGRILRTLWLAIRFGLRSERGLGAHLAYLAEALVLIEWCRKRGVDHVHAHFGTNPAMVALLSRELGGPSYSFTIHGAEPFDANRWVGLAEKVARAAFVVGISNFGVSQLIPYCDNGETSKLHCVRCGLDESFLERAHVPIPDRPHLVFVGRLCEEKAPGNLLLACRDLADEFVDLRLTFVGEGPLKSQLEAQADALGISDRVDWLGACSQEAVRDAIVSARALVLPSLSEGLPVVIMEAYALGRPVVSTFVAGIPELVEPGMSGWLVPAGSVPALGEAIGEVLREQAQRLEEMASKGRERVKLYHDAKIEAAKLMGLFRRHIPQLAEDVKR